MTQEISALQNTDFSFGAYLLTAFDGFVASGPKEFKEFLGRPPTRKIYRSDQSDPTSFMNALRNSKRTEYLADMREVNLPELPVIYYFRKPGLSQGEEKAHHAQKNVYNDTPIKLKCLPATFTYQVKLLSWDKPTLDMMTIALYSKISDPRYGSGIRFDVKYALHGKEFTGIDAMIRDPRNIEFIDESMPDDKGRLWAVGAEFRLATQVLIGEGVTIPETMKFIFTICGFCGENGYGGTDCQSQSDPDNIIVTETP